MSYRNALQRVLSLADFERGTMGPVTTRRRYDLSRMELLLEKLGSPHLKVPAIQITGTKGKGSVSSMLSAISQASGLKTGLYTSPHLHTFRERIQINNEPISEKLFTSLVDQIWPHVEAINTATPDETVTTFELLTAMAFLCFYQEKCQLQVLEVGLGGTLDATNIIKAPLACVITSISLDHVNVLGDTVEAIATDKSGIIKQGAVVVSAPQQASVTRIIRDATTRNKAAAMINVANGYKATLVEADFNGQVTVVKGKAREYRIRLSLLGRHQLENLTCAVAVVEELQERGFGLTTEGMIKGLANVKWPARLEVLRKQPLLVVDGAHNPYSMGVISTTIGEYLPHQSTLLIIGLTQGHDPDGIVAEAVKMKSKIVYATQSRHPRFVPISEVAALFRKHGAKVIEVATVEKAVEMATKEATPTDLILGTGSLFVSAQIREFVLGIEPELYPELEHPQAAQRTV